MRKLKSPASGDWRGIACAFNLEIVLKKKDGSTYDEIFPALPQIQPASVVVCPVQFEADVEGDRLSNFRLVNFNEQPEKTISATAVPDEAPYPLGTHPRTLGSLPLGSYPWALTLGHLPLGTYPWGHEWPFPSRAGCSGRLAFGLQREDPARHKEVAKGQPGCQFRPRYFESPLPFPKDRPRCPSRLLDRTWGCCRFVAIESQKEPPLYTKVLEKVANHQELDKAEVFALFDAIAQGSPSDMKTARDHVALLMKGASLKEIAYIAKAMRANCVPLKPKVTSELMDTCGTGGGLSTFNISTATALVAAAAGIPVAKHGSRSIVNLSGGADVLEALGVNIKLQPQEVEKMIEEIGIAFLYAPIFHPVLSKVLPPEQDPGIRLTFYSVIGPLINPSFAPRHLLGVYKPELLDTVAYLARELGYTRAMFVHGMDGLDEISLLGTTRIIYLNNGELTSLDIVPENFGLSRCTLADIAAGTPEVNAETIMGVFSGMVKGPRRDAVVLNAAGALVVGGKADGFRDGIVLANELIDSGAANSKLGQLRKMSRSFRKSEKSQS